MSRPRGRRVVPIAEISEALEDVVLCLVKEAREADRRYEHHIRAGFTRGALKEEGIARGLRAGAHLIKATVLDGLRNEHSV